MEKQARQRGDKTKKRFRGSVVEEKRSGRRGQRQRNPQRSGRGGLTSEVHRVEDKDGPVSYKLTSGNRDAPGPLDALDALDAPLCYPGLDEAELSSDDVGSSNENVNSPLALVVSELDLLERALLDGGPGEVAASSAGSSHSGASMGLPCTPSRSPGWERVACRYA
jgi:hypothetical protein